MINGTSIVSLHVFILVYSLEDDFLALTSCASFLALTSTDNDKTKGQESRAKEEEEHKDSALHCLTLLA